MIGPIDFWTWTEGVGGGGGGGAVVAGRQRAGWPRRRGTVRFWYMLLSGIVALVIATIAASVGNKQAGSVYYQGPIPDTLRVFVGDTVIVRIVVDDKPGRYWWHLHGPTYVTQLVYRGVIVVGRRP